MGTGLQGPGMGTGGTLFRGDLQVQVMQKSIKEARQCLPLANARVRQHKKGQRGDTSPDAPQLGPCPTSNPNNRAKGSVLYKTNWGRGPVNSMTSQQRGQASPRQSHPWPLLPGVPVSPVPSGAACPFSDSGLDRAPVDREALVFSLGAARTPSGELGAGWWRLELCKDVMEPSSAKKRERAWLPWGSVLNKFLQEAGTRGGKDATRQ